MQVERQVHLDSYNRHSSAEQRPAQTNGSHSNSRPNYSASTNGHSNGDSMNPYQQPYAGGHDGSHHRQYPANQLPPLHPSMSMPPMPGASGAGLVPSSAPQQAMYLPAPSAQLPPPPPPAVQNIAQQQQMVKIGVSEKYKYELIVEQQPQRARMCGFGDKDRRPITPPPCIRLLITRKDTGEPVGVDDVEGSYFVLQVDLWDPEATAEQNIVRSSSTSPAVSISSATTTSFPPTSDRPGIMPDQNVAYNAHGQPFYYPQAAGYPSAMNRYPMPYANAPYGYPPLFQGVPPGGQQNSQVSSPTSMFTRNLIGSLTVNASVLKDPQGNAGFWFVLQDLSVRTEGYFRLKMNFIDVGNPNGTGLNKGVAPVLAHIFSDRFQVFSAKKFPGVIESTTLSKCFAAQGIKIPIRKDGARTERDGDDDD